MEEPQFHKYNIGDIAYTTAYNHNDPAFNIPEFKIIKLRITEKIDEVHYKAEALTNAEYLPITLAGYMNNKKDKERLSKFFVNWLSPTLEDAIKDMRFHAHADTYEKEIENTKKEIKKLEKKIETLKGDIAFSSEMDKKYKETLQAAIEQAKQHS
jgi:hypothetical protein